MMLHNRSILDIFNTNIDASRMIHHLAIYKLFQERDPQIIDGVWLDSAIEQYQSNLSEQQKVRMFKATIDGQQCDITIDMAENDQLDVILMILENIREWVESSSEDDPRHSVKNGGTPSEYTPLRSTVRGAAGSGKSFFIKTLANIIREMFGDHNAVHISAPTGAAAHNVGGETIHRKFAINPHHPDKPLGKKAIGESGRYAPILSRYNPILTHIITDRSSRILTILIASSSFIEPNRTHGSHEEKNHRRDHRRTKHVDL